MVSKNQKMIILVLISLGLIGPLSFIAQEGAKNTTTAPQATPTPPPQTIKLTQIREYTGSITAEIVKVEPTLILVVDTNKTQSEIQFEYSNISNATLLTIQPYQDRHTAIFSVDSPELLLDILYELYEKPIEILDYVMPAEINLPSTFTATRMGKEYELTLGPNDQVNAMINGRTQSGPVRFSLQITESGNQKKITAIEST